MRRNWMRQMKAYFFVTTICLIAALSSVFGQEPDPGAIQQQRNEESLNQRNRQQTLNEVNRQSFQRHLNRQLPKEEIKQIKIILSPPSVDLDKYSNFLRQPKTGLFRLKPNFECNQKYLVRIDGDCQNSLPLGEFYSFRTRDYSFEDFFDLTFKNGKLISGGFLAQGILVSLGNVSMENISLDSAGVKFLADFKPETESPDVKKQFREISQGINSNGFHYGKSVDATVNRTYAFRIIAYRVENRLRSLNFRSRNKTPFDERFPFVFWDKRIDLTLAFQVIRKDSGGSLIILWKELNRQDSPKIIFKKGENLTDINE